jgi:hypothetical protein
LPLKSNIFSTNSKLSIDGLFVGSLVQQSLELSDIGDLNLGNPTLTLGAGVDGFSVVLQDLVAADHLAGDGGEHIGGGLDGLDGTDGLTSTNLEVSLGKLNEDNIAQGVSGIVGDADLGCRSGGALVVVLSYG